MAYRLSGTFATAMLLILGAALAAKLIEGGRYVRAQLSSPLEAMKLQAHDQLFLIFQPRDCLALTEPIADVFRTVKQQVPRVQALGIVLGAASDPSVIERNAVHGGIDFPVMYGNDRRTLWFLRRLGYTSTPVVVAVNRRGEIRFAKAGPLSQRDTPVLVAAFKQDRVESWQEY